MSFYDEARRLLMVIGRSPACAFDDLRSLAIWSALCWFVFFGSGSLSLSARFVVSTVDRTSSVCLLEALPSVCSRSR